MPRIHAEATGVLDAPPAAVYAVLADYHRGHPSILPRRHFSNLVVESGGVGDGTVIRFDLRAAGSTRHCHVAVTEPEPGRTLLETDLDTGAVTRFRVETAHGRTGGSRVTISTEWSTAGLRGHVERLVAPRLLRKIYTEELRNLESVAAADRGGGAAG